MVVRNKKAYQRSLYLIVALLFWFLLACPFKTTDAAVPGQDLGEVEVWTKIVCHDEVSATTVFGPDENYPDRPDGSLTKKDEITVTLEGTCKLKPRHEYYQYEPYPKAISYDVVEQDFKITGQGGGDSYARHYIIRSASGLRVEGVNVNTFLGRKSQTGLTE